MIGGKGKMVAGGGSIETFDQGDATSTTPATTHTFSSLSADKAHTFIAATAKSGSPLAFSSATWGGNAMSVLKNYGLAGSQRVVLLGIAGAQSGDLVLNYSASCACAITRIGVAGLSSLTPSATDQLAAGTITSIALASLASPGIGGGRFAVLLNGDDSGDAVSWDNADEIADFQVTSAAGNWRHSVAIDLGDDAATITADFLNSSTGAAIIGASMR